jgi:hypothetical protein
MPAGIRRVLVCDSERKPSHVSCDLAMQPRTGLSDISEVPTI